MTQLPGWTSIANDADRVVAFFGDSTSELYPYRSMPSEIRELMRRKWGRGSLGMWGTQRDDMGVSLSGTPTQSADTNSWDCDVFLAQMKRLNNSSDIITLTVQGGPYSSVDFYALDATSSANFSYSIDGGSFTNVSATWNQPSPGVYKKITITGPIASSLRIRGANSGGSAVLTYVGYFEPHVTGESGSRALNFASSGLLSQIFVRSTVGNPFAIIDIIQPKVAFWMFTNDVTFFWDASTYQTRLETWVNYIQSYGGEPVILSFAEQNPAVRDQTDQEELRDKNALVAANENIPIIDFYEEWGDYATANAAGYLQDDVHPSIGKGVAAMTEAVWGLLGETGGSTYYSGPS